MSITIMRNVWEHSRAQGSARLVLLALAWHADDNGIAWPSTHQLARYTGLYHRSVTRHVRHLMALGELEVYISSGHSNTYIVAVGMDGEQLANARIQAQQRYQATLLIGDVTTDTPVRLDTPAQIDTPVRLDTPVKNDRGGMSPVTGGDVTSDIRKDHYRSENRHDILPGATAPGGIDDPTASSCAMRLRAFLETSPDIDPAELQTMDEESQAYADTPVPSASDGSPGSDDELGVFDIPDDAVERKPARRRSEKQQRLDAMVEALRSAFGWEAETVTRTEWGVLRRAARELLDAGATPDDVPGLYSWALDQRWSSFTPMALVKHWSDYRASQRAADEEGSGDWWAQTWYEVNAHLFGGNGKTLWWE